MNVEQLKCIAAKLRYDLVAMIAYAGSGHTGGSLSLIEILTALYYGGILKYHQKNPKMPDRDRLIMSKGHGSPALYVVLADLGFFPKKWLKEFDASGSQLPKHGDRFKTPGIEASSGALGQGISIAVGMALAERLDKKNTYHIYCIVGDGECQSGNLWEAVMSAAKYRLDNLTIIVDENRLQVDGFTDEVMPLGSLREKWRVFGWHTVECDGHDIGEILRALNKIRSVKHKPQVVVARTVKGKGVSFMENKALWHSAKITPELARKAFLELEKKLDESYCNVASFLDEDEHNILRGKRKDVLK